MDRWGNKTVTNVPLASPNGILFGIPYTTGHTVGDLMGHGHTIRSTKYTRLPSNDYKSQSIIERYIWIPN